jgi:hypothetical protein
MKEIKWLIILAIVIVAFCIVGMLGGFSHITEYGYLDFSNHNSVYLNNTSWKDDSFRLPWQSSYHKVYILPPTDNGKFIFSAGTYYIDGTIQIERNVTGAEMRDVIIRALNGANPLIKIR